MLVGRKYVYKITMLCISLSPSEIMDQISQNLVQMICLRTFLLATLLQKSNTKMVDAQTYDVKVMLILLKNIFI